MKPNTIQRNCILAVSAVSFGAAISWSQLSLAQTCDIKLENGDIYIFDHKYIQNRATTLTITNNLISYVGNGVGENCTQTIDLGGKVVIPGLNDAHNHYFNRINAGGHVVAEIDTARSTQEVIQKLIEAIDIQNVPPVSGAVTVRNFLVTEGGNSTAFFPSLAELDQVDRPVLLAGSGSNIVAQMNTAAKNFFETANVGSIGADGSASSISVFAAHLLSLETAADRQEDWLDGNRWNASVGMTAMQVFDQDTPFNYPEILELYDNGLAYLRYHDAQNNSDAFLNAVAAANDEANNPDMLRLTGVGEFTTGANFNLGPVAGYDNELAALADNGISYKQHSIFGTNDAYISAWEEADALFDIGDLRWRLDHVNDIVTSEMDRLDEIGSTISVHGIIRPDDLRAIYDHGINVSTGADGGNFTTINPWVVVESWVTGNNSIEIYEALHMYTVGGAYDTFDEEKYGSLEVGKFADLAVLAINPFTTNDLLNTTSSLTIVDGDIVYSDGSLVSCDDQSASGLWFRNLDRESCTAESEPGPSAEDGVTFQNGRLYFVLDLGTIYFLALDLITTEAPFIFEYVPDKTEVLDEAQPNMASFVDDILIVPSLTVGSEVYNLVLELIDPDLVRFELIDY